MRLRDHESFYRYFHKTPPEFEQIWNFPQCVGTIDGKYVILQAPACSGPTATKVHTAYVYVVPMATCNAHYCFTLVDIGDAGRHNDGCTLSNSALGQVMEVGVVTSKHR